MCRFTEILNAPNLQSAKNYMAKKVVVITLSTEFDLNYFKNVSHINYYQIYSVVFVCIYWLVNVFNSVSTNVSII